MYRADPLYNLTLTDKAKMAIGFVGGCVTLTFIGVSYIIYKVISFFY